MVLLKHNICYGAWPCFLCYNLTALIQRALYTIRECIEQLYGLEPWEPLPQGSHALGKTREFYFTHPRPGNALENCVGTLLPVSSILLIKRYYLLVFFFQERTIKDNDKKKGRNRCQAVVICYTKDYKLWNFVGQEIYRCYVTRNTGNNYVTKIQVCM